LKASLFSKNLCSVAFPYPATILSTFFIFCEFVTSYFFIIN
jgi:hypothetical protein